MPAKKVTNILQNELVVTAQQSRFHVDASENASKEIDVKDLSITVGGRDLLSHATFILHDSVHYVLVGRNGSGKTTLLKAFAENRIPGIKWNLNVLLLGQTQLADELDYSSTDRGQKTVVQYVTQSDAQRERLLWEVEALTKALESVDPLAAVRAIRQLDCDRQNRKLSEAREIAARRSGSRGKQSRTELLEMEQKAEACQAALNAINIDMPAAEVQIAINQALDVLSQDQALLGTMNAEGADAKARSLLRGLGFKNSTLDSPFISLSGGWRTRCDLACALFQDLDILLLDECTNFLDLPAVIWLENYIKTLTTTTVVVITHDRAFADAVGDELLILRDQKLEHFKGTVSTYERERYRKTRYLTKMKDAQDRKVQHMEDSIRANINAAKRTGDDKRLKQAASRRKKIEERTGLEVGLKGGRFKLNRDLPGFHLTNRDAIDIPTNEAPVKMVIPSQIVDLRYPGAILSMKNVAYAYFGTKKSAPLILQDINLVLHPGERVGIVGLNGAGKSTLANLVTGVESVKPYRGTVEVHSRSRIGRFSQHSVEELAEKGARNKSLTALAELLATAEGELTEQDARGLLSGLGLPGRTATEIPVSYLSGGQKVRLALAKVVFNLPNMLILDEVTTHLDSDTVVALIETLKDYQGAILLITHDRFFMKCVVEGESPYGDEAGDESEDEERSEKDVKPGVVYHLTQGKLKLLPGGMAEYEDALVKMKKVRNS